MSASRKQYPSQTGLYKVKVKDKPANFVNDNGLLRLEISVGQPYHEGEKFRCTVEWAKHRHSKIVILVNDSLQRFNYMFEEGMSEKEAHHVSTLEGTKWLSRNMNVISSLPDFEIYRWDEWKQGKDYSTDLHKSRELYKNNPEFRNAIDGAISEIWQRKNLPDHRKNEFFDISRDYLLEETAVFSVIYGALKGVSAYPGSFQEMWAMFLDKDIPDAPEGLKYAHCLRIDFSKRPQAPSLVQHRLKPSTPSP